MRSNETPRKNSSAVSKYARLTLSPELSDSETVLLRDAIASI
jgi:hypothetical protein